MKKLLTILFFLPLYSLAQSYGTTSVSTGGKTANIFIYVPPNPIGAASVVFWPGDGESTTDTNKIYIHGPAQFIKAGWRPNFYVIVVQPPSAPVDYTFARVYMNWLFRGSGAHLVGADTNRIGMTGLSYGGYDNYIYLTNIGMANGNGIKPWRSVIMSYEWAIDATQQSYWFSTHPAWGFCDVRDAHNLAPYFNNLISVYPGTDKRLTTYTCGSTPHGCWDTYYDPTYTDPTYHQSIYDFLTEDATPALPVTNAGPDRTVLTMGTVIGNNNSTDTVVMAQTFLDGSKSTAGTGTITSVSWSKISGPAGAHDTIYKGNTLQAVGARFDVSGTYSYKLIITNTGGDTDADTVVVTASKTPALITPAAGLTIKQIAGCEYLTNYLASDGQVYRRTFNGSAKMLGNHNMIGPVKRIAGGQYWGSMVDSLGWAFLQRNDVYYNAAEWVTYDTTGKLFDSVTYSQSYISSDLFLRNGNLYIYNQDRWGYYGVLGIIISKPMAMPMPSGKTFSKIDVGEGGIVGLATDGTVWQYVPGNPVPVQRTLPRAAIDIMQVRKGTFIALVPDAGQPTTSGWPYVWGLTDYAGGTGTNNTPTDYRSIWGITAALKKVFSSDESPTAIDVNGHMQSLGWNGQGEVGNGYELVNKAELYQPVYASNWLTGPFVKTAVDITPAGKTIVDGWGGNAFGFYKYALASDGTYYSWGRNKSFDGGDGRSMSDGGLSHANGLDILQPTPVNPLYATVDQRTFIVGTAVAGSDQSITVSTATFTGHTTATTFYTQDSVYWHRISGPGSISFSRNDSVAIVTGLTNGTHKFVLRMTDNNTGSVEDTVSVTVALPSNPTANAGSDQVITLPTSSATLNGTASSAVSPATIAGYLWTKTSGPGSTTITGNTTATPTVSGLQQGVYVFNLVVTDSNGNTSSDTVQVTVNAAPSPTNYLHFSRRVNIH